MSPIPDPDFILNDFQSWLSNIFSRCWWIAGIAIVLILFYLAVNWASKKKQEFEDQVKNNLNQPVDDDPHLPRPPSSL